MAKNKREITSLADLRRMQRITPKQAFDLQIENTKGKRPAIDFKKGKVVWIAIDDKGST